MKVKIKITETLEKVVIIEAKDNTEGIVKAAQDYTFGKIALNENDFVGFEIKRCED